MCWKHIFKDTRQDRVVVPNMSPAASPVSSIWSVPLINARVQRMVADHTRISAGSPGSSSSGNEGNARLSTVRKQAIAELHQRRTHIALLQDEVHRERAAVDALIVAIAIS